MTTKTTTTTVMATKELLGFCEIPRLWYMLFLLVVINPVFSGYSWGQPSRDWRHPDEETVTPEFETATSSISALVGQPVYLPCRVRNLGDRVVSWIRTRDLHILTSGTLTYTSDSRFEVLHTPGSEMWTLRIMSAQPRDQGKYECQVNTDPKINYAVQLTVKETDMRDSPWEESPLSAPRDGPVSSTATASIMGPPEQYVRQGSTVTFTCVVSSSPYSLGSRPPRIIDWFHSGRPVTIQSERGGISVDTERTEVQTTSKLTVAAVTYLDSGNYTCRPTEAKHAAVTLIVLEEHSEAMQGDGIHSKATRIPTRPLQYELFLLLSLSALHLAAIR